MDEDSHLKLCRLCLKRPEEEPIWLSNQNIKEELYEALSDVELEETDKLSQIICRSCMNLIMIIRDFKQSIKRNQSFLLLLLQKPNWGQFVELNVINPEIKEEEFEDLYVDTSHSHQEEGERFVKECNDEPLENDSLSDEVLAIAEKDSEIKPDTLPRYHITLTTPSGSKPFVKVQPKPEPSPLDCVRCTLSFRTQRLLDKHNRNTHIVEDYPFACDLCISSRFVSEEILNLHKKLHESDEAKSKKQPFACSSCELRFYRKTMLDNHVKYHQRNYLASCQICGKTLYRFFMSDHLSTHKTNNEEHEHVCSLCEKRFPTIYELIQHKKVRIAIQKAPEFFKCDKCGKMIKTKSKLAHHVKQCRGSKTEFPCKFCGQKFQFKTTKYRHEYNVHSGFKCKRCNMQFDCYNKLRKHCNSLEHKTSMDKKYVCSLCEKRFTTMQSLMRHKRSHGAPGFFECAKCGKGFMRNCNFAYHVKRCQGSQIEIPGKIPFRSEKYKDEVKVRKPSKKDSMCDNDSEINSDTLPVTRSSLNRDIKVRQNPKEKLLKCVRCTLYFRTQRSLDKHNVNTHIVEDHSFACNLCISARFLSEEILNLHKKLHDPDVARRKKRPFACSACELRFRQKTRLDNHVKHHESDELSSCQICGATIHYYYMPTHLSIHNMDKEDYEHVCSEKRFPTEDRLMKHEKAHKAPECFKCDKCGKVITLKRCFIYHVKRCRGSQTEYPCRFCGQKFQFKSAKYKHEYEFHSGFKCKKCNMQFDCYSKMRKHWKTLEHKTSIDKKDEHVCSEKRFPTEDRLMKHKKTHKATGFKCGKCGKTMKKNCNFTYHVKQCRGSQTEYPCKFCRQKFQFKSARYKHQHDVHIGFGY